MNIRKCNFPARSGLELKYDLTVDESFNATVKNLRIVSGVEIVEADDWTGTLADGDVVWATPGGLVLSKAATDEDGKLEAGAKPESVFETGEAYWILARTGDTVLALEVA